MWGSSPGAGDPIFWRKMANFLVTTVRVSAVSSPEKLATFFAHHCRFYSFHSFIISPIITDMQKFADSLIVRPLFVGRLFGRTC